MFLLMSEAKALNISKASNLYTNKGSFCSKEALGYWQDVDFYIGGSEHAVGHLLYSRFWNQFMFDIGLVPHAEFAKKLVNQGMIGGRSNFVFRAKERFFEQFLQKAILIPFFKEFGPNVISSGNYEEDYTYDFTFDKSDLVIEVTSIERQEKIERIKENSAKEGKRLLVLFTETLADHINEPNKIADLIARAMESLEELIVPVDKPVSRQ